MTSKIKIKVGQIEIDFEGTEEFLKKELPALLKTVSQLCQPDTSLSPTPPGFTPSKIQLSTANIAAKLNAKSGPDVVVAACAHLSLVQKKDAYDRKSILAEMKRATGFYKSSYRANLGQSLQNLVKSEDLTQNANDSYSLHANKLKELNTLLGK